MTQATSTPGEMVERRGWRYRLSYQLVLLAARLNPDLLAEIVDTVRQAAIDAALQDDAA